MELENSQNNALVRENGNLWVPILVTAPESGPSTVLKMTVPSTAEEKICKKNDVKAQILLLMALPNEHQLTFNQYVDAFVTSVSLFSNFASITEVLIKLKLSLVALDLRSDGARHMEAIYTVLLKILLLFMNSWVFGA
ncbi:hypothetical protein Tco_1304663 [Tanacetum coccineum]